jgi:hypothetical protein
MVQTESGERRRTSRRVTNERDGARRRQRSDRNLLPDHWGRQFGGLIGDCDCVERVRAREIVAAAGLAAAGTMRGRHGNGGGEVRAMRGRLCRGRRCRRLVSGVRVMPLVRASEERQRGEDKKEQETHRAAEV